MVMPVVAMGPSKQRSPLSTAFTSSGRVLFTALLFTAGGTGRSAYSSASAEWPCNAILHGGHIDMTLAYKHFAIPFALALGAVRFCGASAFLEIRSKRNSSVGLALRARPDSSLPSTSKLR